MDDAADLAMLTSPNRVSHRRVRSDPSDFLRSLARADRFGEDDTDQQMPLATGEAQVLDAEETDADRSRPPSSASTDPDDEPDADAPKSMSALFSNLPFQGPSPSMFTPEELAQPKLPNYSKKDVPMWTVEEDLLILQLVEQHGKKWSKIAAHLPGRTDNGVRNRWNRMERAHVIKQRRPAGAGYRCRRCGEPKRGHICAARTFGKADAPEGDDLHIKAAALTDLSAKAMQAIPAALPAQPPAAVAAAPPSSPQQSPPSASVQPLPPPEACLPRTPAAQSLLAGGVDVDQGAAAAAPSAAFCSHDVDDFLDELRRSLDDSDMGLASSSPLASSTPLAQARVAPQAPPTTAPAPQMPPSAFAGMGSYAPSWVSAASHGTGAEHPSFTASTATLQQHGGTLFGPAPSTLLPPPLVSQRSLQQALSALATDPSPADVCFTHAVFA